MSIHSTAIVHPQARLDEGVEVGPYCIIEENVSIGPGTRIAAHTIVKAGTSLGAGNSVAEHAVLGGLPQHVSPPGPPGELRIGDGNTIREHVTMHRSLYPGCATTVGSRGMFMAGCHVAHDCVVGEGVILANNVLLAGHVQLGDRVCCGGAAAIQQFCRIGRLAMIGGMARVAQDVPPFVLVDGGSTMVVGLNRVGLRRAGLSAEQMTELKAAYRVLYRRGLSWNESALALTAEFTEGPPLEMAAFLQSGKRGFLQERRTPPGAVLRVFSTESTEELRRKAG